MTSNCTTGAVQQFTAWCRDDLFTGAVLRAAALLERACDLHIVELCRKLHLARHLEQPRTAAELAHELGFVESAPTALEAMLVRLALRTGVVRAEYSAEPIRFVYIGDPAPASAEMDAIRSELGALGPAYAAAIDFLDFGAEHFVHCLRDDPDFMDRVLTGREPKFLRLWERATNEDPLQDAHGAMGARLVQQIFPGGTILEVGGGTGNGTRHVLSVFERDKQRIEKYIFTDVSVAFILGTRMKINTLYPWAETEWRRLDINNPFQDQSVRPESLDLIYGVNAAHIARDTLAFAVQCRNALRRGGQVVFAERLRMRGREMAPRELTLNLSIYHRTAAIRNPDYRPLHGYLAPRHWERVLELAGFTAVQIYPDLEQIERSFPDQYAGVIVAEK
jgi:SAM-dependent methyltransferase